MSRRRLIVLGVATAAVAGAVAPSFAQSSPVTVHVSTTNGVAVGVDVNGQPGAGASVSNGEACVGISLQVPACVAVPPLTTTRQKLPVTVYHDDTRTVVGVSDVGVVVYSNGQICPAVSTQDWPCVGVQLG
jgi:hypothetical protein